MKSRALLVHEDEGKLLVAVKLAEARQYVFAVPDPGNCRRTGAEYSYCKDCESLLRVGSLMLASTEDRVSPPICVGFRVQFVFVSSHEANTCLQRRWDQKISGRLS